MKVSKETIEQLQQRLKKINEFTPTIEIEELLNAVSAMSKLETTDDILELSEDKLTELKEYADSLTDNVVEHGELKISQLSTNKDEQLSAITNKKQEKTESIGQLSSSKLAELNNVVDNFETMKDIPSTSSIMLEISAGLDAYNFLKPKDLPFVFGILSRYDDYYGFGRFTSQLGTWYNSGADIMLSILTGSHEYTTEYTGFYLEPKLCLFQGSNGNFNSKKSYVTYQYTSSQYTYPYAALGCFFVKNVIGETITSTINFGGSSYWSSGYEGASMFVGTPDYENEEIAWTNVFSYSSSSSGFSSSASITVPANTTVCVLFYTSSYYITSPSSKSYHAQFIHWRMNNIRSGFLVDGLEIDFDRTLKAWQCTGFFRTYELFR